MLLQILLLARVATPRAVNISVDVSKTLGLWTSINRFFGCDEPNFAYYPHGSALIKELGALGQRQTYFRTHNLLTTGDSSKDLVGVPGLKWGSTNAYTENIDGSPIYNFTIIDRIFDAYLAGNVRPYVQIGFMPQALASNPEPYFFEFDPAAGPDSIYTGWSHTPTDYGKWEELVYQWAQHSVERYGLEEFYELHDRAIAAVLRAVPTARVGGCEVAGGAAGSYLGDFLAHCASGTNYATGETGTPLDFISFHAKGAPLWINSTASPGGGYVQLNISTQLRQIDEAFGAVASFPQYKSTPIVMGEYDPDGCAACTSPAYGYRNGLLYPAYSAASFMRAISLAMQRGVNLTGALTWAFEYEQTALLPNETEFFDGFRVLSTQGIDKPVLNVHRMLGMMDGDMVETNSSGQVPLDVVLDEGIRGSDTDVGVVASFNGSSETLYVFVWNYHDRDLGFPDADIGVEVHGLPSTFLNNTDGVNYTHYRIDNDHSNSYSRWQAMGSPQAPSDEQYQELVQAGRLEAISQATRPEMPIDGKLSLTISLPVRATSLLVLKAA
ncbi:hypothetical protein INS49_004678 [Diaporthe citri]|uniref:uncharacterized protein n=1 Tax=Diaporthe citri TaxID=83186 RepID=UPI001C806389|nr:uncharacterized protein INS49_004678 [Diaporthe citri]KAG6354660.1 hypothetical protein INS49_004678 [Diaporthe citri]